MQVRECGWTGAEFDGCHAINERDSASFSEVFFKHPYPEAQYCSVCNVRDQDDVDPFSARTVPNWEEMKTSNVNDPSLPEFYIEIHVSTLPWSWNHMRGVAKSPQIFRGPCHYGERGKFMVYVKKDTEGLSIIKPELHCNVVLAFGLSEDRNQEFNPKQARTPRRVLGDSVFSYMTHHRCMVCYLATLFVWDFSEINIGGAFDTEAANDRSATAAD
ncbi:hypothetical protein F5146DRAFT_997824 [Armillaria mellea]|nr:hypothetical protein F5146DRAFT_997824 [Armillaria mellea]